MSRPSGRRLLGSGEDPDPRFTLANERTFLAWIRTSLAFLAAGIAVDAFAEELIHQPWRTMMALALIIAGTLVSVSSVLRWYRVESALRTRRQLPLPLLAPLIATVLLCSGVLVGALALLQ